MGSQSFDENVEALGMGFAIRQVGNVAQPRGVLRRQADKGVMRTRSTSKDIGVSFPLGKELDEITGSLLLAWVEKNSFV